MLNILTEPVFRMDKSSGARVEASLPEVYAALMREGDDVEAFPALRPHQRHAWHAFLVQLGAMAMHRAGKDEPPDEADEWRLIIRDLTLEDYPDDEPWQLVVGDITKPAFMQPPASDWTNYDKKDLFWTPDALDMLDTAKNHDLKTAMGTDANVEDWVFSLIAMQTMNGQVGRGNYPIARMNSGDGSRTAFSVTPSLWPGVHVQHDMTVLLERSSEIFDQLPFQRDGIGLLWTKRWDGEKQPLPLSNLHPFFIEICRRRRLCIDSDGHLYAMKAGSEGRLIAAAENRGVVGDPWTLIDLRDKKGDKALTLQTDSFTYRRITDYLTSGDWRLPVLYQPAQAGSGEQTPYLLMRGIRRKKGGQTEGYYERHIFIREKARNAMFRRNSTQELEDLGNIAQDRIVQIGIVQTILKDAVATFIAHGKDLRNLSQNDRRRIRNDAGIWSNQLDAKMDTRFFDDLQDEFEETDNDERKRIRNKWLRNGKDGVVDHAEKILYAAESALPCRSVHRYRARVQADSVFRWRLRGNSGLPFLFDDSE